MTTHLREVASGIWVGHYKKMESYMLDVFLGVAPTAVNKTNIYIASGSWCQKEKLGWWEDEAWLGDRNWDHKIQKQIHYLKTYQSSLSPIYHPN